MSETLERARAGDRAAFDDLVQPYRRELLLHCYRMLGSMQDAEDALQETLLAAWMGLDGFEGRSSVRTWLHRIATRRSLNVRRTAHRRPQAARVAPSGSPAPTTNGEVVWLQPFPDALLDEAPDPAPGPDVRYEQREAVSLAFVRMLQLLPPRQRAVLVLRDVLGYRAAEVAEMLGVTEDSANGALKRARASVEAARGTEVPPLPGPETELVLERFLSVFGSGDVEALVELFADDVWVRMPPLPAEYHGREAARGFFEAVGSHRAGIVRMERTGCNGHPAWGEYVRDGADGGLHLIGVLVVELRGDRIEALTHFDTSVAASLGLPRRLEGGR